MDAGSVAVFRQIDINGDGALDLSELQAGLADFGASESEIESFFFTLDSNADNQVSESEFVSGYNLYCMQAQPGEWKQVEQAEGPTYFYNTVSRETTYTRPALLGGKVERLVLDTGVPGLDTKVAGSAEFVERTQAALALLERRAPLCLQKISKYIGLIEQGNHSGMWAYEKPPRYEVHSDTSKASVTWYASTMAHDATHSELYHQNLDAHAGLHTDALTDCWTGRAAERVCNAYQVEVLERIGAPIGEIRHLHDCGGCGHADVNGDGKLDWADYEAREW